MPCAKSSRNTARVGEHAHVDLAVRAEHALTLHARGARDDLGRGLGVEQAPRRIERGRAPERALGQAILPGLRRDHREPQLDLCIPSRRARHVAELLAQVCRLRQRGQRFVLSQRRGVLGRARELRFDARQRGEPRRLDAALRAGAA